MAISLSTVIFNTTEKISSVQQGRMTKTVVLLAYYFHFDFKKARGIVSDPLEDVCIKYNQNAQLKYYMSEILPTDNIADYDESTMNLF